MLRTAWRVRTHEVLEQGNLVVHRTARRCGQAPYGRTSVTTKDLSRHFVGCQSKGIHSASKVIGLLMKSVWSHGEFEAVTDVTLEGQSLVSLPSASTSGSSPWFRKEASLQYAEPGVLIRT
jgi:hypothetical protein